MSNHPLFLKHSDVMNAKPDTEEEKERLVEEIKSRGNFSFKAKSFEEAEVLYTQALVHFPQLVVGWLIWFSIVNSVVFLSSDNKVC